MHEDDFEDMGYYERRAVKSERAAGYIFAAWLFMAGAAVGAILAKVLG